MSSVRLIGEGRGEEILGAPVLRAVGGEGGAEVSSVEGRSSAVAAVSEAVVGECETLKGRSDLKVTVEEAAGVGVGIVAVDARLLVIIVSESSESSEVAGWVSADILNAEQIKS